MIKIIKFILKNQHPPSALVNLQIRGNSSYFIFEYWVLRELGGGYWRCKICMTQRRTRSLSILIQISTFWPWVILLACYTVHTKNVIENVGKWIANHSQETILFLSVASLYTYLSCDTVDIDLAQDVWQVLSDLCTSDGKWLASYELWQSDIVIYASFMIIAIQRM